MKAAAVQCPTCGTPLSRKGGSEGLCPSCLLAIGLDDTSIEAEALVEPTAAHKHLRSGYTFQEGQILGGRYRLRSLLGRGGMGDVWRAYDLKLRQDVALKALRTELIQDREALEALRKEVRTARGVISPNVCRVFDLEELDGQELVLMEYIDGTTLQETLKESSPLDLEEAREIASQFLAGLEAIHDAGLVHRDIKPENVMVTRTGRVVVMDFGITKDLGDRASGLVSGTPPYMSPEQAKGAELDAGSDVFSVGVVLAEMVQPGGVRTFEDRQKVWERLHHDTPKVSETPWSRVIDRCVSRAPDERFASAAELARALEEVTLRAAGDDHAHPYPGLSAFQEADAAFFYGRELEVEALWRKLRRPHLLPVIGPSGAGKSSFLRAGLLPTLTDEWQALITTPGNSPFDHLARALPAELGDMPGVTDLLQQIEEPDIAVELLSEWRRNHEHALLIIDQFEELFTQNPPDVQERFAALLGRLPLEIDTFVLLSMRDDFLFHCQSFEALAPVFAGMTPLGPPTGASLRRAIVQPALKCGYRFEDESLVEGMLHDVEGERGSLPMVAFAMARLWEHRDRDKGLLTLEAYNQIGGVSGALAQHAENTLEQIGSDRIPIVRELFRNLITSQGTRAARDRDQLLSVFDDPSTLKRPDPVPAESPGPRTQDPGRRNTAAEVLDTLIDARLLTSYEVPEEGGAPHRRIEIVHESLLSNWPRLVRWQTQDAEGAQLRDELRSQAKLWDQHARSEDYVWTGTAFREYQLWRERYPGGLTDTEEAFAEAMTSLAARKKRRRRIVVTTVIAVLLAGLTVVAGLWHRAEQERLRAEAGRLLALGELEIDSYPTAALAWATKSLEVFDTREGRMLALRALQRAPPATVLEGDDGYDASWFVFSPTGNRLAVVGWDEVSLLSQDETEAVELDRYPDQFSQPSVAFPSEDLLVAKKESEVSFFSIPDGEPIRTDIRERPLGSPCGEGGYLTWTVENDLESIYWRPYGEGSPRLVGTQPNALWSHDRECRWLALARGSSVFVRPLDNWDQLPRKIGEHSTEVEELSFHPSGDRVVALDKGGELRIWSIDANPTQPRRVLKMHDLRGVVIRSHVKHGRTGRWLGLRGMEQGIAAVRLWDLEAPAAANPLVLLKSDEGYSHRVALHPGGRLAVSAYLANAAFWPLPRRSRWVFSGFAANAGEIRFSLDGKWILLTSGDGLRAWPVDGQNNGKMRILIDQKLRGFGQMAFGPTGEFVAVGGHTKVLMVPVSGGPAREMPGVWPGRGTSFGMALDFSPNGRLLAAAANQGVAEDMVIRVWDLETDEIHVLGPVPGDTSILSFEDDRHLRWVGYAGNTQGGTGGERVFDLEDGSVEIVAETGNVTDRVFSSDGEFVVEAEFRAATLDDLELFLTWKSLDGTESRRITTHSQPSFLALHPSDQWIVSAGYDGLVNVGPVSGEEPHLLVGHRGLVRSVAVSPDGRWIASVGDDRTVRVWPFPDMTKPPLHILPLDELIAELHARTNVRVVADQQSSTGWKLDYAPFPGWAQIPEWP